MVNGVLQRDVEKQLDVKRKAVVKGLRRKEVEATTTIMAQAEGEGHIEETAKLDAGLPEEIEKAGEQNHEKAESAKKTEKAKLEKTGKLSKKEPKLKQDHVNAYGFIHLGKEIAEKFGAPKGVNTPISIEVKDGALIIRKA